MNSNLHIDEYLTDADYVNPAIGLVMRKLRVIYEDGTSIAYEREKTSGIPAMKAKSKNHNSFKGFYK